MEGIFYGVAAKDVAPEYNVETPALVIFKHGDDKRIDFTGDLTNYDEVKAWLDKN
jgi:hypothetical protein